MKLTKQNLKAIYENRDEGILDCGECLFPGETTYCNSGDCTDCYYYKSSLEDES